MKDISLKAEISIASLYQYFPEKAAIIATLAVEFNQIAEECVADLTSNVHSPTEIEPALCEILDSYYEFFQTVSGSYAIWQAIQSDVRLYQIDENHGKAVSGFITELLMRALPQWSLEEAQTQATLFTILIASVVREATAMESSTGGKIISAYKSQHLSPSVERMLKAYE